MRILTYTANEDVPPGMRVIGRLLLNGEQSPIIFLGSDPEQVRGRLTEWWAEQMAKEAKRTVPRRPKKPASEAPAPADDFDVI